MNLPLTARAHRRDIPVYFTLVFLLSWMLWIPSQLAVQELLSFPIPYELAQLLGAWIPALVSVLLTALYNGKHGLRLLLRRLIHWRVGARWVIFALLWPLVHSLISTGVSRLLGAPAPDFANPPVTTQYPLPPQVFSAGFLALLPLVFLIQFFGSSLGEEPGWRGFALPRLQSRHSALLASLLLGVIWSLWHLPRSWVPGEPFDIAEYLLFSLGLILDTVIYTWIFNNTGGSLLPVMLYHTAYPVTALFLAESSFPWVRLVVQALLVLWITARYGAQHLTRQPTRVLGDAAESGDVISLK